MKPINLTVMSDARNTFGREPITRKSKKLPVRLDLTALVSISSLLIMFFMLSSYMSRPQTMDLGMPDKSRINCGRCFYGGCGGADDRSITLLLSKNNEIISFYGILSFPYDAPKKLTYDKNSLRQELLNKSKLVLERYYNDPKKGLIVIIKPSKESSYENLIDILDEMKIADITTYAIVDLTPEEKMLLNNFK